MVGFLLFFLPFSAILTFVLPGLFDSTMMSRLAIYPLVGSLLFYMGRKQIPLTHLIIASVLGFLSASSLLWSSSPVGGIPYAVRWISFSMMIAGFSGTVSRWGLKSHLLGLTWAAAVTALLMLLLGANSIIGNANRAGMILALGFVSSLIQFRASKWYCWLSTILILAGMYFSSFLIGWISCLIGAFVFFSYKRVAIRPSVLLFAMIAGQIVFSLLPDFAGRIGPTLEIRSRIWRYSSSQFFENLPLGSGTGTTRLTLYNSAEPELRELTKGDKRVDFLHSEPLAITTEMGIPGLLLLLFILLWMAKKCRSQSQLALLSAFWPIFASDLPLATPFGALPSALFLASISPLAKNKVRVPGALPVILICLSAYWGFLVISGYRAMSNPGTNTISDLEVACSRLPWEERAFLVAGHAHLQSGMILSAMEDSRRFNALYPGYYRGWELKAAALSAAGRNSYSAWAKAALLVPENVDSPDKYLFAINAISPTGIDPDTTVAITRILAYSDGGFAELISKMSPEEVFFISAKLFQLAEQCRPLAITEASRAWFMASGFAIGTGENLPQELAAKIVQGMSVYPLEVDWDLKAAEYLAVAERELGIESIPIPSP